MEYVRLGEIRKPFGLKGELTCLSMTEFAKERFKKGTILSLLNEKTGERKEVTLRSYRDSGNYYFLSFEGIDTPEAAEELRGLFIEIDKENAPIPEGYIRFQDIMGFKAIDKETREGLGTIIDVLSYSPTKNLRIKRENGKTFTVPFVKQFVGDIDFENKTIEIIVVEGLL
ncbi:MAG: 16S rRNA processing protein RimM [Bacilli bacterium]|nr:16S rRNA processing protein RimM [Bacilli bacterium]